MSSDLNRSSPTTYLSCLDSACRSETSLVLRQRLFSNVELSIIGPQFFSHPPRYGKLPTPPVSPSDGLAYTLTTALGIGSCIFTFAGMIVTSILFQVYIMWLNKNRALVRLQAENALQGRLETGFENLTDKENPLFLYVY